MLNDNKKCFACGLENPHGLQLTFHYSADGSKAETRFTPESKYQGWENVVHGGILMTVMDETMAKVAVHSGHRVLTGEISAKFKKPADVQEQLTCIAEIEEIKKKIIYTRASIFKQDGTLVSEAHSKMFITG